MNQKYYSRSVEETEKIAAIFAEGCSVGSVIGLRGELGSGKTKFVQGFAKAVRIRQVVNSPTFSIIHSYRTSEGLQLNHIDLYRIKNPEEAFAFGIEEFIFSPKGWTFIEWIERLGNYVPKNIITINIELGIGIEERTIEILYP